ncbi:MAG: hypothetical protein GY792_27085, partial [Gammaproteobacteria bacterium]|nr:hypothetical protein [Gammaproteobacteria bacterium]
MQRAQDGYLRRVVSGNAVVAIRCQCTDVRQQALPGTRFPDKLGENSVLLSYFEEPLQAVIVRRLAEVLVPGGLLLLGSHEYLPQAVPGLVQERPWL